MVREYFGENARLKQAFRRRAAERSATGKRNELAAQTLPAVALDKSLRQAKSEALLAYPAPGDSSDPLFRCPDICQACRNVGFRSAPPSLDQFLSDAFAKLDAPVGAPMSAFAAAGSALVDNNYSAIPAMPGSKMPGAYLYGRWNPMSAWTRFCDRLPTDIETTAWSRWPNAGVGIVLGHGVVAVDIDTDDSSIQAAILRELPELKVGKRGQKGATWFYRGTHQAVSYDVNGERVLDLLGVGRFSVLPPTLHPSSVAYTWISSDTLIDTLPEQLPLLPDDAPARLAAALTVFGYHSPPPLSRRQESRSSWQDLKEAALANLAAWVPQLLLPGTMRTSAGYRAVAAWRGVKNANLSFHPTGIRDMGANQPYSPIDVVMATFGYDFMTAALWLKERVIAPDPFNVSDFIERNKRNKS